MIDRQAQQYRLLIFDWDTAAKPNPQMLYELLQETTVSKQVALMIGDTEYDMIMAQNAGVAGLGVATGVHARERLLQCRALDCLDHLHELPTWLTTIEPVLSPNKASSAKQDDCYA